MDIKNLSGIRVGYIDGDDIKNTNGGRIGYISGGDIKDTGGSKIGYISGGDIKDTSGGKIGYIDGNDIKDTSGNKVGYVDGSGSTVQIGAAGFALLKFFNNSGNSTARPSVTYRSGSRDSGHSPGCLFLLFGLLLMSRGGRIGVIISAAFVILSLIVGAVHTANDLLFLVFFVFFCGVIGAGIGALIGWIGKQK
jgi:hypothetical protein